MYGITDYLFDKLYERLNKPKVIERHTIPLYKERGWKQKNGPLVGYYRTRVASYRGLIVSPHSRRPSFYIYDPAREILEGEHSACFHARMSGKYWIHFSPKPSHPDTGIRRIEYMIMKAHK